ncbi:MAG: 23S rRNA (pseudouridine(1915)-N(3))-methyltransferase RlmH [Rubrobacteraceae bacterium]|nr:23S rRNA (pseudouridine(1915)-N(3))-methyltransferase RlmH [Rubrobacteraceae bacterium]
MRRATIVAVGKLRGWAADGSEDYLKRLRRYFSVEVAEVAEDDMNRRSREEVLSAEASRLLKRIPSGAYVIALDREKGKALSSEDLAQRLTALGVSGRSHVAFLIGGPLGLSPELLGETDEVLSFGRMTLPHALARVVLLEQLYRAAKIERGEKYHW